MNFNLILNNLNKFFHYYWRIIVLSLAAILFFVATSSFNFIIQRHDFIKWLSPDETANYTFSKLLGQENKLAFFEKYNLYVNDIIKPRSFRSDAGWLKPVSFLGLPIIYGQFVKLTTYKILPYLTTFFAAVGIIFYYLLIKKIFGRQNAFISSLLLVTLPIYLYYSARSMFHNVLFIVLLVIGLYYSTLMSGRKNTKHLTNQPELKLPNKYNYIYLIYSGLAGFFIGLAITVRTSELIWLIPLFLIIWFFNIKRISLTKIILFLSFMFLSILPTLYWNRILYGSIWAGGYNQMNQAIINITQTSGQIVKDTIIGQADNFKQQLINLKNNIFYFGFHPKTSLKMFYHYFVVMFYWVFWPAILGGLILIYKIRKWKIKHWAYMISYLIISLILLFYYGSWGFHDNPDPNKFTIGNSYTRYWLPIYLGALPLAAIGLVKFSKIFKKKIFINLVLIITIIFITLISLRFVIFGSNEGLYFTGQKFLESKQELTSLLNLTENNSVIITRYHDKLLFPERKVIVGLFDDDAMNAQYAALIKYLPVYYYNFTLPPKDFDYLNNVKLPMAGLQINEVAKITDEFTLYKLSYENK